MERVYLDNAASTKILPEVLDELVENYRNCFGNPSSTHREGQKAKKSLENSREVIAGLLGVEGKEIIFTSGGAEGNNLVLKGAAEAYSYKGKHIITSNIEHPTVLNTCIELEEAGYEITYLNVDSDGVVNLEELKNSLRKDTIIVSIMSANNETGVVQPINEIGRILSKTAIFFHVDAVQTMGKDIFYPKENRISAFTASSHKFYGPKGTGFIFLDKNFLLKKQITGGHQERNRRAGTEDVNSIFGMQKALEVIYGNIFNEQRHEKKLHDYLEKRLREEINDITINGEGTKRLNTITNVTIKGCDVQTLMVALDLRGIYISAGSACMSGAFLESNVLKAMHLSKEDLRSTIRISMGRYNTENDIDIFMENLKEIVKIERGE
ncbi:MAG: cysteine desulfurase [Sebaldella sp.]|nr:cysteine desulfurase [Sebaldella sp.]